MSADGIQPPEGGGEQKSFIRRHPFACAGCGCFSLLLLLGVVAAGVFWGVMSLVKSSDAYKLSLARARRSPALRQALGQPLEPSWLVSGSVKVENDSGSAHLQYELTGPKGSARLTVDARRAGGKWRLTVLRARLQDGGELDLLQEGGGETPGAPAVPGRPDRPGEPAKPDKPAGPVTRLGRGAPSRPPAAVEDASVDPLAGLPSAAGSPRAVKPPLLPMASPAGKGAGAPVSPGRPDPVAARTAASFMNALLNWRLEAAQSFASADFTSDRGRGSLLLLAGALRSAGPGGFKPNKAARLPDGTEDVSGECDFADGTRRRVHLLLRDGRVEGVAVIRP